MLAFEAMNERQIEKALAQVQEMQRRVIDAQRFSGYQWPARAIGGLLALLAAALIDREVVAANEHSHLIVWVIVCLLALLANYGSLFYWFASQPVSRRELKRLTPALNAIAPLFVGGLLSLACIRLELYALLFGIWMLCYGLVHIASQHVLSPLISQLGWFYILCGAGYLFQVEQPNFLNPWPMGIVFFIGELAGAWMFYRIEKASPEKGEVDDD